MKPLPKVVHVSASVRLTVVVDLPDAWGGDCAMSQVYSQAATEVEERLEKAFPSVRRGKLSGVRIVGEPEVVAVTVAVGGAS